MDQVDEILVPILRDTGCKIPTNLKGFQHFQTEHLVNSVSTCLHAINPKYKFPIKMPSAKAARFRLCTSLSEGIEELGYSGQTGYQAFLYPNEGDVRNLMIWLVDQLPRVNKENEVEELIGSHALLYRSILGNLKRWSLQPYIPNLAMLEDNTATASTVALEVPYNDDIREAQSRYFEEYLPFVSAQPPKPTQLIPSLFEMNTCEVTWAQQQEDEWNQGGLDGEDAKKRKQENLSQLIVEAFQNVESGTSKSFEDDLDDILRGGGDVSKGRTGFERKVDFEVETVQKAEVAYEDGNVGTVTEEGKEEQDEADEESEEAKREEELHLLNAKIRELLESIANLTNEIDISNATQRQIAAEIQAENNRKKAAEATYKVKRRVVDLLPDAKNNLVKLEQIAQSSSKRLVTLAEEWETHRGPLISKIRSQKQLIADRKEECRLKLEEIKRMRQSMKALAKEIRTKDAYRKQVAEDLRRLPKSVNRQVYVRRIMDIMSNLEKQKVEIRKILEDIRNVQREINSISETSKRSFVIVDDMIFKAAEAQSKKKKDAKDPDAANDMNQVYKYLVGMKESFDTLVESIEKTGNVKSQVRSLETQIEAIGARNSDLNHNAVKNDLKQVKKDNQVMSAKLKKMMAAVKGK